MDLEASEIVMQETSEILSQIEEVQDPEKLRAICRRLVPLLIAYWDIHPHSAMESLEYAALVLPLSLAHSVIRQTVVSWRRNPNYDPDAGGNADHCYLSALILSENYDLAEHPWADNILETTLRKDADRKYGPRPMRDQEAKLRLVNHLLHSSRDEL